MLQTACQMGDKCPKSLTFPKAERDQRCPRLVVFWLFISTLGTDWFMPANRKSDWQINIDKQQHQGFLKQISMPKLFTELTFL